RRDGNRPETGVVLCVWRNIADTDRGCGSDIDLRRRHPPGLLRLHIGGLHLPHRSAGGQSVGFEHDAYRIGHHTHPMKPFSILRRLAAQARAATAVEFAFVGGITILTTFGIIDFGMVTWTQNALQSVAAMTARCTAISSPLCTDGPAYAVSLANDWT